MEVESGHPGLVPGVRGNALRVSPGSGALALDSVDRLTYLSLYSHRFPRASGKYCTLRCPFRPAGRGWGSGRSIPYVAGAGDAPNPWRVLSPCPHLRKLSLHLRWMLSVALVTVPTLCPAQDLSPCFNTTRGRGGVQRRMSTDDKPVLPETS